MICTTKVRADISTEKFTAADLRKFASNRSATSQGNKERLVSVDKGGNGVAYVQCVLPDVLDYVEQQLCVQIKKSSALIIIDQLLPLPKMLPSLRFPNLEGSRPLPLSIAKKCQMRLRLLVLEVPQITSTGNEAMLQTFRSPLENSTYPP